MASGAFDVVVVGAGWIGLEAAAASRGYENDVSVVKPQPVPMRAALGDELGAVVAELSRQPVALARIAKQGVEVEVVGLLPAADPHLDVADVAVGAPAQRLHAR